MLTPTSSNQDMDQVSVLSSDDFRKDFGQAMSVTGHGSKVDLRQTLTFDNSVGIYDVTAESSVSASDVCDAVAAASGDCLAVCFHLPVSSKRDVACVRLPGLCTTQLHDKVLQLLHDCTQMCLQQRCLPICQLSLELQ